MRHEPYILGLHRIVERRRREQRMLRVALVFCALALGVLSLIILSGCASSTLGKGLNVGVVASATADYVTTRQGIESGRAVEANPLMGQGPWQQAALKAAGASAVMGAAALAETQGQRTLAHVLRVIYIAVNTAVAAHNYQVWR